MQSSTKTLSEKIYHELYQDIINQKLPCGQKLTLNMLKERFHVSHTPIREALTRLSANGLVTYYSNCGVKVIEFTENDIKEIYQFMGELDAMAIEFCNHTMAYIPLLMELEEIISAGDRALENDDPVLWKESSERIHVVFYEHAQNRYLSEAAEKVRARLELLSTLYYKDDNVNRINESHKKIFEAVKEKKFSEAAQVMREHLQRSMMYAVKGYADYQKSVNSR